MWMYGCLDVWLLAVGCWLLDVAAVTAALLPLRLFPLVFLR